MSRTYEWLNSRRREVLSNLRNVPGRQSPLSTDEWDQPLEGYRGEYLGSRRKERRGPPIAVWHARYTEWTDALDWLFGAIGGQPEKAATEAVEGLGRRQVFDDVTVIDRNGIELNGLRRDQALAEGVLAALSSAAGAAAGNRPARLWRDVLLKGLSPDEAAERDKPSSDNRRAFNRRTWRYGLADLDVFPTGQAASLRSLLASLERSYTSSAGSRHEDELPPALATQRAVGNAPLVGRQLASKVLTDAWDVVQTQERHQVVMVSGEAGMGKSELLYEFARSVQLVASIVASAAPESADRDQAEVVDLLRQLDRLARRSDPSLAVISDAGRRALRIFDADWHASADPGPTDRSSQPVIMSQERRSLYEAAGRLLEEVASQGPVMVVVEDLHNAGADSVKVIASLIDRRVPRVLFVLTYRPNARGTLDIAKLTEVAHKSGGLRSLSLHELDEVDLVTLLHAVHPGHDCTEAGAQLYRLTGGHPMFATWILRSAVLQGVQSPDGLLQAANLEDVFDLINRQVEDLPDDERSILRTASVIGKDFEVGVLARALDRDVEEVGLVLDRLEAAGFLTAPARQNHLRFRHELLRDAVYFRALATMARAGLHRAVARALKGDEAPDHMAAYADQCYEAAAHFEKMRPEAVAALIKVARDAVTRTSYEQAVVLYRKAFDRASSDEERARIGAGLGDALYRLGHLKQAQQELERAEDAARTVGAERGVELLAEVAIGLSVVAYQSNASNQRLRDLYQEVLDRLPEDEVYWRVRLRTALARETPAFFGTSALPAIAQSTIELAACSPDPATRAYGYLLESEVLLAELNVIGRLQAADRMLVAAKAADDPYLLTIAHTLELAAALERLDRTTVDAEIEACERVAKRFQFPYAEWHAEVHKAGRALFSLPLVQAEAAIEQAYTVGKPLGYGEVGLMYEVQRAFLRRELGRIEETEDYVRFGATEFKLMAWKAALAYGLHEVKGGSRSDEASPLLAEFEQIGFDNIRRDGTYPLTLSFLAQAYACRRARGAAEALLPVVLACLGRHPATVPCTYWGSMDYYAGLLHATAGDYDAALERLNHALNLDEQLGSPLWKSHTLVAISQALRARNETDDHVTADAVEAKAREVANAFGYKRIEQELDGLRLQLIAT